MTVNPLSRPASRLGRWLTSSRIQVARRCRPRSDRVRAEGLEARMLLSAQLVKDLIAGPEGGQPMALTTIGDRLIFSTGGSQPGLWVSDGTDAGTVRISDARIGTDSYEGRSATALGADGLFFNGPGGLWKTDGTPAGTALVKALDTPALSLTSSGGIIYFTQGDSWYGEELWRSDGTADGTVLVKDIDPGQEYDLRPRSSRPRNLTDVNGTLFFTAFTQVGLGYDLWKGDGTETGTVLVKDINPGNSSVTPFGLTNVNGRLFFAADDGSHGYELWKSDGTPDDTVMVSDIRPGPLDSLSLWSSFAALGDALLFTVGGPGVTTGLWRSDGTETGTFQVAELPQPAPDTIPTGLTVVDGSTAYFISRAFGGGTELWKTDGTADGTTRVKTLPGLGDLLAAGDMLYFTGADAAGGEEVWQSDGTEAGTVRTADVNPGPAGSRPVYYTPVDGRLFFRADDGQHGDELWKIDLPVKVPAAPTALSAVPLSGGEIDLAWADNSNNEAGFIIERSATPDFAAVAWSVKLLPGTVRYVDSGLASGATYYYRVLSFNRAGMSSAASATAATPVSPAAPSTFSATAVSHARVDLAWADNSSDESGFRIERSPVSTFGMIDATYDVGPDAKNFTDTAVAPETHYFYRVSAVGPAGRSAAPRAHAGTPGRPPTSLEGWGVSANGISLQWSNPQDGGLYSLRVERANPGEVFAEVTALSAGTTSYGDGRRRPNSDYRYRVRAVGPFGPTVPSNEVSVTTPPPVLATLVKDLNTTDTPAGSNPSPVVALNGIGYFAAEDMAYGRELWRTDGTPAGTWRVLDLMPGADGAGVDAPSGRETSMGSLMAVMNGALYFRGDDGSHGVELWKTDGTEPGTVLVADTLPGADGIAPAWLTEVNGTIFFASIRDGELWKSDGTAAGTVCVKDIRPGPEFSRPGNLVTWNGVLYFSADDGTSGRELWRSDGTEAGTYRISDIAPDAVGSDPQWLTPAGSSLYFSASNPNVGRELWKTDGTLAGTVIVKDINPGGWWSDPQKLFADGNTLLFAAADGTTGMELWRSDGSEAGTMLVADLLPGPMDSSPFAFTPFKGKTYLLALHEGLSHSLYETDGTAAGTRLVKELPGGSHDAPTNMLVFGDSLYFVAVRPNDGGGLGVWKSDGTGSGTVSVSGPFTWFPRGGSFASIGSSFVFPAAESYSGDGGELWRSDGTEAGTYQLKNIRVLNGSSSPSNLTAMGNQVYFTTAADSGVGAGLWRSDGTDGGTVLIRPGPAANLTRIGPTLYFTAADAVTGNELWKTDGTPAGTILVKDVTPGAAGTTFRKLTPGRTRLYFTVRTDSDSVYQLWTSDGTAEGTAIVSPNVSAVVSDDPYRPIQPLAIGDTLYFRGWVRGGPTGAELWRTDGTPVGTSLVKDVWPGPGDSAPFALTNVGGTLYFVAWEPASKHALWKSDGTELGTVLVADVYDGVNNPPIGNLTPVGNALYFTADEQEAGYELWKTDGTPSGTGRIVDLYPGPLSSGPSRLTAVGNTLYFAATTGPNQRSLWKTDGTAAGTRRIRALIPDSTSLLFMVDANGTLFYADGGTLLRSDGTGGGTVVILQVAESASDAYALGSPTAVVGDTLFVRGYDPAHGRELWSVSTIIPAAPSDPAAAALGGGQVRVSWRDNSVNETGFLVDRIVAAPNGLLAAEGGEVVDRTFFVDANDIDFVDSVPAGAGAYRYRVRAVNAAGPSAPTAEVSPAPAVPAVVGWNVFYNDSAFDGNDPRAGAADDAAIAPGKQPLLPGQVPGGANITNFTRGINGVMIDISGGLPLTALAGMAGSVRLRMGTGGDPATWPDAPQPSLIAIRPGAGTNGSDRVTLIWPDGAIKNTWLQLTVRAQPQLGFDRDAVYYFGNLVGDTGDGVATFRVNALDLAAVRRALNTTSDLTGRFDFNRDGRVNALDLSAVRRNLNGTLGVLTGAAPAPAPAFFSAPAANLSGSFSTRRVWDGPLAPLV